MGLLIYNKLFLIFI